MSDILVSMMITPDGTELNSRNRHDYRVYTDKNGELYMLDGGTDYVRHSVNKVQAELIILTTDSPHETIRERFTWGSYGKGGDEKLHYVKLMDMEDGHIKAIIKDEPISSKIETMFLNELDYRG